MEKVFDVTETVRVSRKYQIVIPKQTREALNINRGDKLVVSVKDGQIIMKPMPNNYTEYMRGLHKEVWEDVDTAEYLEEERKTWI